METLPKKYRPVDIIGTNKDVQATEVGMLLVNPDATFEDIENVWKRLDKAHKGIDRANRCVELNIGDCMVISEQLFGEKAFQMFGEEDWNRYRNMRWVSRYVPIDRRREEEFISFDHYRAVAPLKSEAQEYYLSLAVREKLSTRKLRDQIDFDFVIKAIEATPEEDQEFWRHYWNEMGCDHTHLEKAIENGREAAEQQLKDKMKLKFDDWYNQYMSDPENEEKTMNMKFSECWIAAQQNV